MAIVLTGLAALSVSSLSQEIPGPADPGQVERRFDKPASPRATEGPDVVLPEAPGKPKTSEGPRFRLKDLLIDGATVYAPDELYPLYQKFIGRLVSLTELQEIARQVTRKYRRDVYILSRAIVPGQEIADGTARIRVVEGYIDDVRFDLPKSIKTAGNDLLSHYANKILASRPLRAMDLERYLLLASDLPGFNVRSVLQPSDKHVGAAALDLHLVHTPLSASVSYDNRGSRFVGPEQSLAGVYFNSLLGRFNQTTFRLALAKESDELIFADFRHSLLIGSEGLVISFEASRSESEPGFTLDSFDVESIDTKFATRVTYPFVRSRARNITFGSSFEARSVTSDILGDRLARDRLRVLRATAIFDFVDRYRSVNI